MKTDARKILLAAIKYHELDRVRGTSSGSVSCATKTARNDMLELIDLLPPAEYRVLLNQAYGRAGAMDKVRAVA